MRAAVYKEQRFFDRRARGDAPSLLMLPDDLLMRIAACLRHAPSERALALAHTSLRSAVEEVPHRSVHMFASRLWPRGVVASSRARRLHYSHDLRALFDVLRTSRFRTLRRLAISIDAPALLPSGRRRTAAWLSIADAPPLRSLTILAPVSDVASALAPDARAVARLLMPFRMLQSVTLSDIPNLGLAHVSALKRCCSLRVLSLVSCTASRELRAAVEGSVECPFMPEVRALTLDVRGLTTALLRRSADVVPRGFLSACASNLRVLTLTRATSALSADVWFFMATVRGMAQLDTIFTDCTTTYITAYYAQGIDATLRYKLAWSGFGDGRPWCT